MDFNSEILKISEGSFAVVLMLMLAVLWCINRISVFGVKIGLIDRIEGKIDKMEGRFDKMDEKIDKVEKGIIDKMDERFEKMDEKFEKVNERFEKMDEKIDKAEKGIIDRMDEKFEKVNERFEKMDERFEKMDEKIDKVEKGIIEKMDEKFEKVNERFEKMDEKIDKAEKGIIDRIDGKIDKVKKDTIDKMEGRINKMKGRIDKDKKDISYIKAQIDVPKPAGGHFAKNESPLALTPDGKVVSKDLEIPKLVEYHWASIEEYMKKILKKSNAGANPYDIQQASIVASEKFFKLLTMSELDRIKRYAFQNGHTIPSYDLLLGIIIRDLYFKKHNITIADAEL